MKTDSSPWIPETNAFSSNRGILSPWRLSVVSRCHSLCLSGFGDEWSPCSIVRKKTTKQMSYGLLSLANVFSCLKFFSRPFADWKGPLILTRKYFWKTSLLRTKSIPFLRVLGQQKNIADATRFVGAPEVSSGPNIDGS